MPPHSEIENDLLDRIDEIRCRKRRKRSRSISPGFRRTKIDSSNRSSRSSSVASEIRAPLTDEAFRPPAVTSRLDTPAVPSVMPVIVCFHEAPSFLQFNPFIYRGYRANLCTITCIKSLFWWTNETLNAWTHLLGWMYFAYFTVHEVIQTFGDDTASSWHDSAMQVLILVCFQICMAMSTGYHTFCCHSKDMYHCWLSYDLCGISFSLLAIYTTGIYYAFWCQHVIRNIYIGTSIILFVAALVLQTTPKYLTDEYSRTRLIFFVSWSTFGVLPCIHWTIQNGGFSAPNVFDLVSQIGIMYLICGLALFFYISRIPEVWFPGCVDYIGSSHQLWHIIIFLAFYHWHLTGKYFADFRAHHGCFEDVLMTLDSNNTVALNFW